MIKRSSDNASLRGCGYAGGYDAAEAKSVTYRVDSRPARLVVVSADQVVASARQLPAEESHFDLGERRTYTPRKGEPADYAQRTLLSSAGSLARCTFRCWAMPDCVQCGGPPLLAVSSDESGCTM